MSDARFRCFVPSPLQYDEMTSNVISHLSNLAIVKFDEAPSKVSLATRGCYSEIIQINESTLIYSFLVWVLNYL